MLISRYNVAEIAPDFIQCVVLSLALDGGNSEGDFHALDDKLFDQRGRAVPLSQRSRNRDVDANSRFMPGLGPAAPEINAFAATVTLSS